ncbi:MAG: DUF6816 family protein, partial [Limnothrix sp.]
MFRPIVWKIIACCLCFLCWFPAGAWAKSLASRLDRYPDWDNFPMLTAVQGSDDLVYPQWMAGTWKVTSILTAQVAPFAPDVVTPGFENNRKLIGQPFTFLVKFQPQQTFITQAFTLPTVLSGSRPIVADRAFNGLAIAQAYLGENGVKAVKTDPNNPNRQLTRLNNNQTLISTVTGRATEYLSDTEFLSSEMTQQQFRGAPQLYLNQVETTTKYRQNSVADITAD